MGVKSLFESMVDKEKNQPTSNQKLKEVKGAIKISDLL